MTARCTAIHCSTELFKWWLSVDGIGQNWLWIITLWL